MKNMVVIGWVVRGVLLSMLCVAILFAHSQVRMWQRVVAEKRVAVEQRPLEELEAVQLKAELGRQATLLDRALSVVVREDQVAEVVTELERLGSIKGVSVEVRNIEKEVQVAVGGAVVDTSAPIVEVRLELEGRGRPEDLLAYLYTVENLRYLSHVRAWNVQVGDQVVTEVQAGSGVVPEGAGEDPASNQGVARLSADVMIAVRN